jgi:short-subunit dehydrogenase
MTKQFDSILITGASSGIGASLAQAYAAPGVRLALTARDGPRLEAVAAACRERGAEVETALFDATNAAAMDAWVATLDSARPLDLVIANAGMSRGKAELDDIDAVRQVLAVNVDGVLNVVMPALRLMRRRRSGSVAIMSSIASFRGIRGIPAYSASKAAIRVWGESMRSLLLAEGIAISVICPGYVATPLTAGNRFRMPFLMDAERATRIIQRGLARGRARIAFPLPMYLAVLLLSVLPQGLADRLTGARRRR